MPRYGKDGPPETARNRARRLSDEISTMLAHVEIAFGSDTDATMEQVTEVRLRVSDPGVQVVVKALSDSGEKVVAFTGGYNVGNALLSLERALADGSLKWKPDRWSYRGKETSGDAGSGD